MIRHSQQLIIYSTRVPVENISSKKLFHFSVLVTHLRLPFSSVSTSIGIGQILEEKHIIFFGGWAFVSLEMM